jgi:hypothetical protein
MFTIYIGGFSVETTIIPPVGAEVTLRLHNYRGEQVFVVTGPPEITIHQDEDGSFVTWVSVPSVER